VTFQKLMATCRDYYQPDGGGEGLVLAEDPLDGPNAAAVFYYDDEDQTDHTLGILTARQMISSPAWMRRDREEEEMYDVQRHNETLESTDYAAVASAIGKKNDKENLVTRIFRRSTQSFRRLSSTDKSTEKPKKNFKGPNLNEQSSAKLPLPKLLDPKRLSTSTKSLNIFPTATDRQDRIKSHLNVPHVVTSELRKWTSTGKLHEKGQCKVQSTSRKNPKKEKEVSVPNPTNFSKPRNATFTKKPVKNFVHANKSTVSIQNSKPSTSKTQDQESKLGTNLKPVNEKLGGSNKSLNSENVEENKKNSNIGRTNLQSSLRWPKKPSEIETKVPQTKPNPVSRKTIVLNKKPPPHNQLQVSMEKVSSPKPKPIRPRPASQIPLLSSNVAEQDRGKRLKLASPEPAEATNPLLDEVQALRVKVDMLTNENLNLKEVLESIKVSNLKVLKEIQTATDNKFQKVDEERRAWKILHESEKENFTLVMNKFTDFEEKITEMTEEVKGIKSNLSASYQAKNKVKTFGGEDGKVNEVEEKGENFNNGKEKLMNRIRGINARMSSSGIGMKEMMQKKSCNEQLLTSELEKIQVSVTTKSNKSKNSRPPSKQDISEPVAGDGGNQFSNITLEENSILAPETIGPPSSLELSTPTHRVEEISSTFKFESEVGLSKPQ